MKKRISIIINELVIASTDEIKSVLVEHSGDIKNKILSLKIKELEKEKAIFNILPEENSHNIECYIAGPNIDAEEDFEINEIISKLAISPRDLECIDWKLFSSRILDIFLKDIKRLHEDLEKVYDEPKNIEMKYFEISIEYHELYRFFFDLHNTNFLISAKTLLEECRNQLNKKDFGGEPIVSTGT